MFEAKALASGYTGKIYIVWDKVHDNINKFEIYRNDSLISESTLDIQWEPFEQPTIFDHDHHTNLFKKDSTHQLMFTDESINKYQQYTYYVKAYRIEGDIIKEEYTSDIMYVTLS